MRPTIALLALLVFTGCDPIVGARCADGLVLCEGRCVATCDGMDGGGLDAGDLDGSMRDGAIDGAAGDGAAGDGSIDGSAGDGAAGDGSIDGSAGDGAAGDGSVGDGGVIGCGLGELECGGVCVDGLSDPDHCGACDRMCAAGEVCASGTCRPTCDPPLVLCAGRCIDVSSDPENCGGCGIVCRETGLCIDGECSSALAGHVVVIGHDYESSRTAQDRLAGNALFLARGNPVRALVWSGTASAASRRGVDMALDRTAAALGRSWTRNDVTAAEEVPYFLAESDAMLVLAQPTGSDAALRALGASWSTALREFLVRGGVVVVFETMSTAHAGTWQILDAAGLFTATGRADATGGVVGIVAPADAVAARVPLSYLAARTTVRFATTDATVVARDPMGPVVVHRTVVP